MGFTAFAITVSSPIAGVLTSSPSAASCSMSPLPRRLTTAKLNNHTTAPISVPLAADLWSRSAHCHRRGRQAPRRGTTAHEPRRLPLNHHRVHDVQRRQCRRSRTCALSLPCTPGSPCLPWITARTISSGSALLAPLGPGLTSLFSEFDRHAVDRPVQFPIAAPAARGLVQSGFSEIAFRHTGGRPRTRRSRRNLTIIT
jgi:hypothetical protein